MKIKFLIALLIIPLVVSACSCSKNDSGAGVDFEVKETEDVKGKVTNWVVFTNPAYRYELRSPTDWEIFDKHQTGEDVYFYPKGEAISDEYMGELRIIGFTNWMEKYPLDEYIKNHAETNYYSFNDAEEREEFEYRGFYAMRFRNVEIIEDEFIEVLAIDAADRIIVMELYGSFKDLENIIGSLYFY